MLYLKAFREGIAPMPAADAGLRERLHGEADRRGTRALHERLQQIDPRAAARIHPNNFSRIQRALEVHELTGLPISEHWQKARGVRERLGAELLEFGIEPDTRAALHDRIEKRLDDMLSRGFIEEVEGLMRKDRMQVDLPSMRAVGYRQVWEHLEGLTTFAEMRDRALAATRQLAKRQITWMRSWPDLVQLAWDPGGRLAEQIAARSGLAR